jgi:hypothetical protein
VDLQTNGGIMNRFGLAVVMCGLAMSISSAASPDPKDLAVPPQELLKARELVRRLASEDYGDREDAFTALAKMGRMARPALAEAATSDTSAEVRTRAARLLPRAEAEELKARIDTFLADNDQKFEHDLPAWRTFRNMLGTSKATQGLFVEMLQAPGNLEVLVALEQSEAEAGRAIADRRMSVYMRANPYAFGRPVNAKPLPSIPPTLAETATLLFAEILIDSKHIPRTGFFQQQISVANMLQQSPGFSVTSITGPHADPLKLLLSKWLDSRTHPDDLSNYATLNVANMLRQNPESTPLLRRTVTTEGVQSYIRYQALMYLVQRHGKEETPFVRSLVISDKERVEGTGPATVAFIGGPGSIIDRATAEKRYAMACNVVNHVWLGNINGNGSTPVQLRDYALSILIIQSGQGLKDYHFDFPPGAAQNGNQITYPNYAFANEKDRSGDDKREMAIKKWRDYEQYSDPPGVKPNPFRKAGEVDLLPGAPQPNFKR